MSTSCSSIRAQTFPVSCFVVKRGGMVVFCAAPRAAVTFDARFVWMRQKHQGSHFANLLQAARRTNSSSSRIDPACPGLFLGRRPRPHQDVEEPAQAGNMVVLVQAKRPGLRTLEDAIEA